MGIPKIQSKLTKKKYQMAQKRDCNDLAYEGLGEEGPARVAWKQRGVYLWKRAHSLQG